MLATRRGVSAGDVSFASAAERHDEIVRGCGGDGGRRGRRGG